MSTSGGYVKRLNRSHRSPRTSRPYTASVIASPRTAKSRDVRWTWGFSTSMNRVASILALALVCTGCSDRPKTDVVYSDAPAGLVLINGAGATFPYPIYSKWFDQYHRLFPQIQINYQSIGSGGGIRQVIEGTVDFGATDSPMTDAQLTEAKTKILHFPTVLGAVVPAYNIPGVTQEINFTPEALAGIFLGKITKW